MMGKVYYELAQSLEVMRYHSLVVEIVVASVSHRDCPR